MWSGVQEPSAPLTEEFMRTVLAIAVLAACAGPAASQQLTGSRAQQVAASFSKYKNVVRQRAGVTKDKYASIRSEPLVRGNVGDYAGTYEVPDLGFVMDIEVDAAGRVLAHGHDSRPDARGFTIEQARIENALFTGRKVYADGTSEPFEGVFLSRTEQRTRNGPTWTTLGLGTLLRTPFEAGGVTYERLFYQLK
jgi:hypothetical protein